MAAAIKERPILFSGPMVRAILDGTKTQTRRIIKQQPAKSTRFAMGPLYGKEWTFGSRCVSEKNDPYNFYVEQETKCPYGTPGDRLWVRETWAPVSSFDPSPETGALYLADPMYVGGPVEWKWKPSIHMPRWASRLNLEITDIRVERLQDISVDDAKAEGWGGYSDSWMEGDNDLGVTGSGPKTWYRKLWKTINGPDSWAANPWVWVVEFKRV